MVKIYYFVLIFKAFFEIRAKTRQSALERGTRADVSIRRGSEAADGRALKKRA
ncbi:MAG: hypothetical protein LBH75_08355 [Treponema sp.]|jgi:hypothetical protein|nr:hypothetical protein [Treponema sp.]